MKDDFCSGPWADNDGGLWCWKHRDVKGSECVRCEAEQEKEEADT